jgi:hypothetical protein
VPEVGVHIVAQLRAGCERVRRLRHAVMLTPQRAEG